MNREDGIAITVGVDARDKERRWRLDATRGRKRKLFRFTQTEIAPKEAKRPLLRRTSGFRHLLPMTPIEKLVSGAKCGPSRRPPLIFKATANDVRVFLLSRSWSSFPWYPTKVRPTQRVPVASSRVHRQLGCPLLPVHGLPRPHTHQGRGRYVLSPRRERALTFPPAVIIKLDADRKPLLAKCITIAVRCYEARVGRAGISRAHTLAEYTQTLWSKPEDQQYADVADLELPFRISIPSKVGGHSTCSFVEYRCFWRIEACA